MKGNFSCAYNMDTGCVELTAPDGSRVAVNCTALEDELNLTSWESADLDWLIYHKPLEYLNLVFSGELETYLHGPAMHGLED